MEWSEESQLLLRGVEVLSLEVRNTFAATMLKACVQQFMSAIWPNILSSLTYSTSFANSARSTRLSRLRDTVENVRIP